MSCTQNSSSSLAEHSVHAHALGSENTWNNLLRAATSFYKAVHVQAAAPRMYPAPMYRCCCSCVHTFSTAYSLAVKSLHKTLVKGIGRSSTRRTCALAEERCGVAADAGAMGSTAKQGRLRAPPAPSVEIFTLCDAPCTPQPSQARLPD